MYFKLIKLHMHSKLKISMDSSCVPIRESSSKDNDSSPEWSFTVRKKKPEKKQPNGMDEELQKKSGSLTTVMAPVFSELKSQHRDDDVTRGVLEQLEKSLHVAEDICPGVTDRMITHILERVQRSDALHTCF
ncbi:serine/threonine-protein kinase 26-like [Sinocyclocheilus anshuiensis]|uniref:serine/threonine-protein kinase 26-like n=1 Tax=Sinocyclocheilus anshuiensis TaxID=1608454 RepID=UPI0007B9A83D|nr:PREDICTED: serine/threonine-protein kinase 26-like [Sinocyclocheilus anshuiensis]